MTAGEFFEYLKQSKDETMVKPEIPVRVSSVDKTLNCQIPGPPHPEPRR